MFRPPPPCPRPKAGLWPRSGRVRSAGKAGTGPVSALRRPRPAPSAGRVKAAGRLVSGHFRAGRRHFPLRPAARSGGPAVRFRLAQRPAAMRGRPAGQFGASPPAARSVPPHRLRAVFWPPPPAQPMPSIACGSFPGRSRPGRSPRLPHPRQAARMLAVRGEAPCHAAGFLGTCHGLRSVNRHSRLPGEKREAVPATCPGPPGAAGEAPGRACRPVSASGPPRTPGRGICGIRESALPFRNRL
jgi:hypothetical protein